MAETIYRKYRPQTFAEVVNQQHVRITLEQALTQHRLAHAFLFAGPRGIGKTTLARILARAANCTKRGSQAEPCNRCDSCQAIQTGRSLDVIEIDAASQTGVDNVRENIIQSTRSTPTISQYKIFIIDEVHMLSLAAFNALLKVLEEPPAHVIFILATTEAHRIPETIISRTQRFDFKKLSAADMVTRLRKIAQAEKRELGDGVAERIARLASGSMRDAEGLLGQLFTFKEKTITGELADIILPRSDEKFILGILTSLASRQTSAALRQFHQFCEDGGDISLLVRELVETSRVLMLGSLDPTMIGEVMVGLDRTTNQQYLDLIKLTNTAHFITIMEELLTAEQQLHRASLMELPVEVAMVKIGGLGTNPPPVPVLTNPTTAPTSANPSSPKRKNAAITTLPLAAIQAAWETVRQTMTVDQPGLRLSLQSAQLTDWDGQVATVKVPFRLHADRLQHATTRHRLENELQSQVGQPIAITVVFDEALIAPTAPAKADKTPTEPAAPTTGDLWEQIVTSFQ